jgi:hypothetical protein
MSVNKGPKIINDGLVLYLDAANSKSYSGSGTTWTDLSGNNNNGTLTNGPTFDSGNGGSIVFDGSNDFIALGNPSTLDIVSNITVSSWVRITSIPTLNRIYTIFGKGYNGTSEQFFLRFLRNDNNFVRFQTGTFNNTGGEKLASFNLNINSFITNIWMNIAGQYDANTWKLYLNSNLVASNLTNQGPYSSTSSIGIGATFISSSFARYIQGNISSVLVYNRALSANEISQNYNALKGRFNL